MSRRHHRKSKTGCLECKRRHIRCDETHPTCINCGTAEIRCSFLDRETPFSLRNGPAHPAASRSPISTTVLTPVPGRGPEDATSTQAPPDPYNLNLTHLQLFNNLSSDGFLSLEESGEAALPASMYIKHALTSPYLMHQVLAASALHLSTLQVESRNFYREYATGLQNRALALFKESHPVLEATQSNCIHLFLFSSLVGVHVLCDTLRYERDSLEWFVDKYTHCLNIHRGVLAIVDQCWHLLGETELAAHLKFSQELMQPQGATGSECDILQDLIDAAHLTPASLKAYRESIMHLQRVFDAQRAFPGNQTRLSIVFSWPVLVSPDYIDLLRHGHAEALVILAHYGVILHRGRDKWLIGDGGQFLIDTIGQRLGPDWQEWLRFPKTTLQEGLIASI
ncbi:hypothetical protein A1O3_06983 [Capronia epimyces CBS 606.96]|uniref:Zn(2)-C6 fungal-type domain-containing protein n=1 Tax=Capronia epimyces CBS 606.96 TaxID=1182542 RepID=W9YEG4_9EURO|nr:uncharacterized protein A1O3_06983 [Capronia epimyces CBS 606.96]EXJ80699.1 hypothetical protein A1O3_06983 [Capronia epimyces CBS 606.96]